MLIGSRRVRREFFITFPNMSGQSCSFFGTVFLAYLRRLHQTDQAYTRRLLDDEPITVDQVKGFADVVGEIMEDTVQHQLDSRHRPKGGNEAANSTRGEDTGAPRKGTQTGTTDVVDQ
jgi:hypothetical protein